MRAADFVKIAKALADPTRLRMIEAIRAAGTLTCTEVCACFKLSQPTISHHIKMLEASGVVHATKSGAFHVLRVNEPRLREFARHAAGEARKCAAPRSPAFGTPKKPNDRRQARSKAE